MSTTEYYRLALLQYVRMQHNLAYVQTAISEIDQLKEKISARHKKHRRCDKEIEKSYNCGHCQRIYATEVALRLHLKLKHKETLMDKNIEQRTVLVSQSDKQNIDVNLMELM